MTTRFCARIDGRLLKPWRPGDSVGDIEAEVPSGSWHPGHALCRPVRGVRCVHRLGWRLAEPPVPVLEPPLIELEGIGRAYERRARDAEEGQLKCCTM